MLSTIVQCWGQSVIVFATKSEGSVKSGRCEWMAIAHDSYDNAIFWVLANPIRLSDQQRSDLNEIAQSRSLPAGFVFRAKLILMLAQSSSNGCNLQPRPSRTGNNAFSMLVWKGSIRTIREKRRCY